MSTKYKLFSQYLDYYRRKSSLTPKEIRNIIDYSNHDFYGIAPFVPQTSLDILADVASKYELWQKENEIEIESSVQPKTKVHIDSAIHTISDLISIVEKYQVSDTIEYNINVKMLHQISGELRELDVLVGLKSLKKNVLDQILYFSQGLSGPGEYKHMVIYGSPGTGKTDIAKILGRLYANMGILGAGSTNKTTLASMLTSTSTSASACAPGFRKATRSDLVAGYLGQTAIKTKALVSESLGGVLFIDEIYSLGDDSFSKECADTLCELLSDHKDNLIVIVAGYQNEVNERFFKLNAGLESRFTWRFTIDDYTSAELWKMFKNKITAIGWTHNIQDGDGEDWFKRKYADFPAFGRDIEALIFKVKIAHSRRVYGKTEQADLKTIVVSDLDAGFLQFKESMKSSSVYNEKKFVSSMFL